MKTVSQVTLTFVEIFMSTNFHFFFPDSGFRVLGKPHLLTEWFMVRGHLVELNKLCLFLPSEQCRQAITFFRKI